MRFTRHSLFAAVVVFGAAVGIGCSSSGSSGGDASTPASLSMTPGGQDFGTVLLGDTSSTFTFTVKNEGLEPSGAPDVKLGGAGAASFKIANTTCTAAVSAGKTCSIAVTFSPTAMGGAAATLDVTGSPGGDTHAGL